MVWFSDNDLVDLQRSKKNLTVAPRASLSGLPLASGVQSPSPPTMLIFEMLPVQVLLAPNNNTGHN